MKILCVEFENLSNFKNGKLRIDFFANDRVMKNSELYPISNKIYAQNLIGFVGLNATGKTTALRLLQMALGIVIYNKSLNNFKIVGFVRDGTVLRVTFFHNRKYHQLESVIGVKTKTSLDGYPVFYYIEETRKEKSVVKSRDTLTDFSDAHTAKRSELVKEKSGEYLEDDKSIINPIIRDNGTCIEGNLWQSYANIPSTSDSATVTQEIVNFFDESITHFSIRRQADNSVQWRLGFKNEINAYEGANLMTLNQMISTGTIKGLDLITQIIRVLKQGGYLLVDELEIHLNKELVKVILGLFKSGKTNPNGACLIFTTHYTEILDSVTRKDNIYITRQSECGLYISKFSEEFPRNDFKKSEIIISNALKGTAPKYESIQRLRDFVCQSI